MANFKNVKHESIRREVDPKYLALISQLDDCYYKHWKLGKSKPFVMAGIQYDMQPTFEESKALFQKIHGAIWATHTQEIKDLTPDDPFTQATKITAPDIPVEIPDITKKDKTKWIDD